MAGYGWNRNHCPQRPYAPARIACRICNHTFVSTQALLDHIESHLVADRDSVSRRQPNLTSSSWQRNPFHMASYNTCLRPTLPFTPYSYNLSRNIQERNPMFSAATPQIVSPMPNSSQPQISRAGVGNNSTTGSQQVSSPPQPQRKETVVEDSPDDFTRPFLQQLEKPLPCNIEQKGISDSDMLDLTLKL